MNALVNNFTSDLMTKFNMYRTRYTASRDLYDKVILISILICSHIYQKRLYVMSIKITFKLFPTKK